MGTSRNSSVKTQEREVVVKTLKMWIVVAGVALAASVTPVRAGVAQPVGGWGAGASAVGSAGGDSVVWDQPARTGRPDPVLDAMIQLHPQAAAVGASEELESSLPALKGDSVSADAAKTGLFLPVGATGRFAGSFARSTGSTEGAAAVASGTGDSVRAIPAPTAISLFPLGALMAAFAAWRMGRRRAPLLAVIRATFRSSRSTG